MITINDIRKNKEILIYINQADSALRELGFTEHALPHVENCVSVVKKILTELKYSEEEINLAQIAEFMHDIGNVINRIDHAQSGAVMSFRILDKLGMSPESISKIINAIGNHDESTGGAKDAVSAALIIADKTDVTAKVFVIICNRDEKSVYDPIRHDDVKSLFKRSDEA